MNEKTVVSIGEILWDVFGDVKKAGGSSMNVALHLHKQGINSKFISAVGKDENGKGLLHFLQSKNFPTDLVQTSIQYPTSTVIVKLDKRHQATYEIVQPVAWDDIEANANIVDAVANTDALVFCSLTCRDEKSRNTIINLLQSAKLKIFDINLRPPHFQVETLKKLLAEANILKINEDEIEYLKQECQLESKTVAELIKSVSQQFDIQIICLTLGDKGAIVYNDDKFYTHPGFPVEVADTVGAGDAFLATFVASYLNGFEMDEILERACKVGAYVASQPGANPDYGDEVFTSEFPKGNF